MSDAVTDAIQARLSEFVVPATGRALGTGGTVLDVSGSDTRVSVKISCGFPADCAGEALKRELLIHLGALATGREIEVELSWRVASHSVQPGLKAKPGVRNIVAIASGKGGVGKSTVTANVALAAAREGARVGILDADIYGPSQPRLLNLLGERPETEDGKTLEPLEAHGISIMSIGFLVEDQQAVAWRGPMVTSALNQMLNQTNWGNLDYLFVDMPPGTGDIQLTLAQKVPVSGAVIVTTPQDVALSDARKGLDLFRKLKLPLLGVVENMGVHICSQCGHADAIFGENGGMKLAGEYEIPFLGSLPIERGIREQSDAGLPTVVADPDGATARAFRDLAGRITGELAASGRDYSHLFGNVTVEAKQ